MTEIARVEQAGRHDCGVACLAMVLGKPLDHIEDLLLLRKVGELVDPEPDIHTKPGDAVIGVTSFEMQAILWDMGIRHLYLSMPGPRDCEGASWYDRVGHDMPVLDGVNRVGQHLDRGGLAILGVDSLRYEGGKHWIVAQGHDLFDPAPGDGPRYERMSQFTADKPMKLAEAVLIVERE